ncbi:MAG: hypothetical protein OXG88_10350 [Gammaproteobacteria bacterium]|nr:hypothetical protein [Gammaproteobacteria bacterium]
MRVALPESEIDSLMMERKVLPGNWSTAMRLSPKRGHYERQLEVTGENENIFVLILRKSMNNEFDFSVIVAVKLHKPNRIFRLRRYNGLSHTHTNRIESETFYDYHIHIATERYQKLGMHEESYAIRTDRYVNFEGAIDCAISDAKFEFPDGRQLTFLS